MIKLYAELPRSLALAVSGGVDSVAALDFLVRNHDITVVHLNHKEGNSDASAAFVEKLVEQYNCKLVYKEITDAKPKKASREEFWRDQRKQFFRSIPSLVATAHTLDDCVETWLWTSLHANPKVIPYFTRNVIRPFLLTKKAELVKWANTKNLTWVEDSSNSDLTLTRNYIRKELLPHALKVNPGLYKTIYKRVNIHD